MTPMPNRLSASAFLDGSDSLTEPGVDLGRRVVERVQIWITVEGGEVSVAIEFVMRIRAVSIRPMHRIEGVARDP